MRHCRTYPVRCYTLFEYLRMRFSFLSLCCCCYLRNTPVFSTNLGTDALDVEPKHPGCFVVVRKEERQRYGRSFLCTKNCRHLRRSYRHNYYSADLLFSFRRCCHVNIPKKTTTTKKEKNTGTSLCRAKTIRVVVLLECVCVCVSSTRANLGVTLRLSLYIGKSSILIKDFLLLFTERIARRITRQYLLYY